MHNTTWSTDGFHTVKTKRYKKLSFLLCEPASSSCGCTCWFLSGSQSTCSSSVEALMPIQILANDSATPRFYTFHLNSQSFHW
jgi:hypothetical protein